MDTGERGALITRWRWVVAFLLCPSSFVLYAVRLSHFRNATTYLIMGPPSAANASRVLILGVGDNSVSKMISRIAPEGVGGTFVCSNALVPLSKGALPPCGKLWSILP